MAYNRPYNPDELPRFAEPEPKGGAPHSSAPRYDSRPQPPVPSPRHDSIPPRRTDTGRLTPTSYGPGPAAHSGGYSNNAHSNSYDNYKYRPNPSSTMSPPPTTSGPRPVAQTRPPASSRPPPSPGPPEGGADPTLLPLFRAVDKDGGGQLSEKELSAALVNGDWTAFDSQTVRMMIRMFDSDRSGTIGFEEFCGLWSFLASWRALFDRFDADRSGNISLDEFSNALVAFRYRLSPGFVDLLFRTYDKRNEGVMSFDLFVQACISLKRMTDVFKKYDEDRDGYITLSFEDFLVEILKQLK
ncbi:EF-hand [Hypoxylon fragiforme]|uniref:EF-hand n=1 Tax=Hypoxylon fragiforme TaxID=63214 RepID=UPI0020C66E49|nr:EF-hand [Hypoxylon fragiforme]KAI2614425.1 EF-hand [Hypoxylon fragiforme]